MKQASTRSTAAAAAVAANLLSVVSAFISPDGTGRLPALGWNSWNEYACDINENLFVEIGELLADLGLKDVGYNYVNIDDCWSNLTTQRDPETHIINHDLVKFPSGIAALAQKLHDQDLKIGIYSDAGTLTCAGYAGSLLNEELDAATFAEWDIDCQCRLWSTHVNPTCH